jgi:predicted O-linked N-acetylglucosamine transferase (SPINDLY family)/glycosyltransferase involved in cell wall biosynthesis
MFVSQSMPRSDRLSSEGMELIHQKWLERASSDTERILGNPLVSIICFCRNRADTIRRCIDSVLGQSYKNLEFVVQDGASTDGTLEILKSYRDPRVKIVSEPDSGPAEAFWRVMNRCQGDIIGTCLSDEELLPDALERAVSHFRAEPYLGAITGDGYVTDTKGRIVDEFNAGEFNFVDYLFGLYCPFWPGSFFRRQALIEVGLRSGRWTIECLEFETWCRLATMHEVKYIPERMSKYAVHEMQLSQTKEAFHEHFDHRALLIRHMFSKEGFFGEDEVFLKGCLYNQLYLLYNHVRAYKLVEQEKLLAGRLQELRSSIPMTERIRYFEYFGFLARRAAGKASKSRDASVLRRIRALWIRVALCLPSSWRKGLPPRIKEFLRLIFTATLFIAANARHFMHVSLLGLRQWASGNIAAPPLPEPDFRPSVYHNVAHLYYARGQVEQALQMWKKAEAMRDALVDGIACQAMLMSPTATNEKLLERQQSWAELHAQPISALARHSWNPYDGKRKIRVGYACAFLDSDTVRAIMVEVIRERDRARFEVFGYSPSPVSHDVLDVFDGVRRTGGLSDERFVQLVRSDQIDILVELTGFSPQHRFVAMASRCAPVQISYLNHTGTSGVPNVDYVLADPVCVLPDEDRFFSEKVWRLPGCFLSYTYDRMKTLPPAATPSRRNGYVTFGCFGSGGKINIRVIELWAEIMRRVPGSVFAVRNAQLDSPSNRRFMEQRFARYGIGPERLRIEGGTDRMGILESYNRIDISLDTWPYCGGNSIAEPIWQGVPVVTLRGERFSSRYGASLVTAAGCPELVANSADEYIEISAQLAGAPDRLDYYRRELRALAKQHGMSDAHAFARKLEAAYIEMLQLAQL